MKPYLIPFLLILITIESCTTYKTRSNKTPIQNIDIAGATIKDIHYDHKGKKVILYTNYIINPKQAKLNFRLMEDAKIINKKESYDLTHPFTIDIQSKNKKHQYTIHTHFQEWITSPDTGYRKTTISDLVLIYHGATDRRDWTLEQITPYVVHTDIQGKKGWFFDGFLFFDVADGLGHAYAPYCAKDSAKQEHWEWLMERHFAKGKAIHSLNTCIEQQKQILGNPPFKHKVVIGLPYPMKDQKDWGKGYDLSKFDDRVKACAWYIDTVLKRFEEENYNNLELSGFYWIDESVFDKDIPLTSAIGDYIRQYKKLFYWIPYYTSWGYNKWREAGFDIAYHQPNHFFKPQIPDSQIDKACDSAYIYNLGMEMEFDVTALESNPAQNGDRLDTYLDHFEKKEVLHQSSMAYYEGGGAILVYSWSKNAKDKERMDRLANIIRTRRKMNWGWLTEKNNTN